MTAWVTQGQEEEEVVKMAARDQPRSHSSRRDGGVCWSGGLALVGGEVEREVLFLLVVVLRGWHPPLPGPGPYPFFKLPMSLPVPSRVPASLPLSK